MMSWLVVGVGIVAMLFGWSAFFGAPYVPSKRRDVAALFAALSLSSNDTLLDIGSGDGVVLLEANRRGATAIGYEIHPLFVVLSRWRLRHAPHAHTQAHAHAQAHAQVRWANMWSAPFPPAVTVVYAFSVGRDSHRLKRKLQSEANRLGHGFTFACYGNPLPGGEPAKTCGAYSIYYFVPLQPA